MKNCNFVGANGSLLAINREPRESRGQSRCCEPPLYLVMTNVPLDILREGVIHRAASQKTCPRILISTRFEDDVWSKKDIYNK